MAGGKRKGRICTEARRLVHELVSVSVEPALRRERGFVEVVALVTALAGLDEHDGLLEALAVGAGEDHG